MEKVYGLKDVNWLTEVPVGSLVSQELVDYVVNALPPASYSSVCTQLGEPFRTKIDDRAGRERETYLTYKREDHDTWRYCGACFRGENAERGREVPYV